MQTSGKTVMIHSLNNVWRVAELATLFTRVLYDSSPRRCEGRRRRSLNSPSSVLVGEFLEQRDLLSALTVTTTSDTSNDGDTSSIAALRIHPGTDGKISLREAIRAANNSEGPDTITFDPRLTSRGRVTIAPRVVDDITADNSAFAVSSTLTIIGAPNSNLITLKGTGPQGDLRLFRVLAGGNLTLQGLSFTKWATDTNGGVLGVDPQATVTIRNCVFSNNAAQSQGGAIFNLFGTVTLIDSQLTGNRAHDGGAYNGGGQTYGGMASFTNCTLTRNTAVDRGGAIALYSAGVSLTNCKLERNLAHQGGAIAGGYVILTRTTLSKNTAVDGGAVFMGIAGGAASTGVVQVGAVGGASILQLIGCTIQGNVADHRGGGVFLTQTTGNAEHSDIVDSVFSQNQAQQGGGIFEDTSEAGFFTQIPFDFQGYAQGFKISRTIFSANIAEKMGGGIFNSNGATTVSGSTFMRNVAQQGAALYNDLGWAAVTHSAVNSNFSRRGTQLFNHLGIMPLSNSTVSDAARMKFLPANVGTANRFVTVNSIPQPAIVGTPKQRSIITARDGIRYALTSQRILLRQIPGCAWSILDDMVVSYEIAPNGDCTWLNDRRELRRSQAGAAGDLIGQLVRSYAMDRYGTIYDLSDGAGRGNFALYGSLTAPLLDRVAEIDEEFCVKPPTEEEVIRAAGIGGTDIQNLRTVVEPLVDRIDPPRFYPGIGLAQMHHCHYKCTIHYSTQPDGYSEGIIYLDRNHLRRYSPGQVVQSNSLSLTRAPAVELLSAAAVSDRPIVNSDKIHSLWTGLDGTIYKLGGDYTGSQVIDLPPFPRVLWKLPPGGQWQKLFEVYGAAVALDNTLFALNTNHELQRLVPGATQWTKVVSDVQSFKMTEDGIAYALTTSGAIVRVRRESRSNRWSASTLDTEIRSLTVSANGNIYTLNKRSELKRLSGNGRRFVRIETKVLSLEQGADGAIHLLNTSNQLKQRDSKGRWKVMQSGIQSMQLDPDGVVYALNQRHELLHSTPGGHWSTLHSDVQSFIAAPNGLRSVYVLTTHGELLRLEAGYAWRSLRADVVAITINSLGVVTSRDRTGGIRMYWSPTTVPSLDPVDGDVFCVDPPSRELVLRAVGIADRPGVDVVIEGTEDQLDPPRWFSNLGEISANRLHHCHYRCTVNYMTAMGLRSVIIEIDHDSLIRWAGPSSE